MLCYVLFCFVRIAWGLRLIELLAIPGTGKATLLVLSHFVPPTVFQIIYIASSVI
jgi:hypothetical protein